MACIMQFCRVSNRSFCHVYLDRANDLHSCVDGNAIMVLKFLWSWQMYVSLHVTVNLSGCFDVLLFELSNFFAVFIVLDVNFVLFLFLEIEKY